MVDRAQSAPVPFGKYLLDAEIARGGMSRVFAARLRGPGGFEKRLVVKQILPDLARDPGFVELFVREANTLVQMGHAHIVPVYELGVVDGVYFLAMERIEGASVAELLREGPLPEAMVAHLAVQVCDALGYAHERFNLVHRDVTPRNVLVDAEGNARLVDFGIAAPVERTGKGEHFGSPGYMAPEQTRGEPLSPSSDLFSLGAVLYEALTGRRAIERVSRTSGVDDAPRTLDEDAGFSEAVRQTVNGMLCVDASERPRAASEVAARLRSWLAHEHPAGVASALGRRAESARRGASRPMSPAPVTGVTAAEGNTTGEVRSIAKSSALDAIDGIVDQSTERLELAGSHGQGEGDGESDPPTTAATEAIPSAARGRRRSGLVAALLLGAAVAFGLLMRSTEAPSTSAARRATAPSQRTVDTPAQPAAPASETADDAREAPGKERAGARASRASQPSRTDRAVDAAGAGPDSAREGAADPSQARASASPAGGDKPAAARGKLSVSALPWAEVSVDGRALGVTPQRSVPLSAGRHRVRAVCPPLGREAELPVDLAAGEQVHVVIDLNHEPAGITVR